MFLSSFLGIFPSLNVDICHEVLLDFGWPCFVISLFLASVFLAETVVCYTQLKTPNLVLQVFYISSGFWAFFLSYLRIGLS